MNGQDPARVLREAPVTVLVSVAAAVTSLMHWQNHDMRWMILDPGTLAAEPWRAVTTTLLHGGMVHLAFNLMWLWTLGTALERCWGPVRTLATYILLGAGASLAQYAVSGAGVGLSGVVYGLFGLLYFAQRATPGLLGVVPPSVTRVFVVWFFICIVLTYTGSLAVANTAHGAGAALGALLGRAVLARRRAEPAAPAWWLGFLLASAATVAADFTVPGLLRTESGRAAEERQALDLLRQGRRDEAVTLLERLADEDPGNARLWHNLAFAYQEQGRAHETLDALRRGAKVADADSKPEFARMLGLTLAGRAMELEALGDYGGALDAVREAMLWSPALEEPLCMIAAWVAEGTGDRDAAAHWYRMGAKREESRDRALAALERLGVAVPQAEPPGPPPPDQPAAETPAGPESP